MEKSRFKLLKYFMIFICFTLSFSEIKAGDIAPSGCHAVMWNGNQNASEISFVEMETGDLISTRKLMLVK